MSVESEREREGAQERKTRKRDRQEQTKGSGVHRNNVETLKFLVKKQHGNTLKFMVSTILLKYLSFSFWESRKIFIEI